MPRSSTRALIALLPLLLAGCGTLYSTLPPRSAMEQMLISTAADRAVEMLPAEHLQDKAVFIDVSNLECYDKPYVVQRIRQAVLSRGARLAPGRAEAQLVLEVASGGLSLNQRKFLLGLPSIPIPLPATGEVLSLPELALLKATFFRGQAKLLFTAIDTATNAQVFEVPICYGKSLDSYWSVLFLIQFRYTDLPKAIR